MIKELPKMVTGEAAAKPTTVIPVERFKDFTKIVEEKGAKVVVGRTRHKKENGSTIFVTEISSVKEDEKIVYEEKHMKRDDLQIETEIKNFNEDSKNEIIIKNIKAGREAMLRGIVTAEERLARVREELPGVTTIGPKTGMDKETRADLVNSINELNIESYPMPEN